MASSPSAARRRVREISAAPLASPARQNLGTALNTNSIVITLSNAAAFCRVLSQ